MTATTATTPTMAVEKKFTELTDYIYPALTTLNYSDPYVKLAAVTVATLTSIFIYVSTHVIFNMTSSLYQNLQVKEKVFWNLAVVRSCYGIFCIVVATWAIFADTALNQDVVFSTSATSHLAIAITVGFFVFECTALTLSDACFKTFSSMLQIHHWLSLAGFFIVLATETSHAMGCKGLMLEMSTPFSGLCWTLLKAGKERTLLWKANQFLLVHAFHMRNVVEMMLWYISYQHWNNIWNHMPLSLFICLYVQLVLITFLFTPYWTLKKTRQLICPVDWNFESAEVKAKAYGHAFGATGAKNGHVFANGAKSSHVIANGAKNGHAIVDDAWKDKCL